MLAAAAAPAGRPPPPLRGARDARGGGAPPPPPLPPYCCPYPCRYCTLTPSLPPLGGGAQGVNHALADVGLLGRCLARARPEAGAAGCHAALAAYDGEACSEARALVRLMQVGAPWQYSQPGAWPWLAKRLHLCNQVAAQPAPAPPTLRAIVVPPPRAAVHARHASHGADPAAAAGEAAAAGRMGVLPAVSHDERRRGRGLLQDHPPPGQPDHRRDPRVRLRPRAYRPPHRGSRPRLGEIYFH